MRSREIALTGPQAAALHGLDGFRDKDWPVRWCAPITGEPGAGIIRTRLWRPPEVVAGVPLAPMALVLRHLGEVADSARISSAERAELAVEHALRLGKVTPDELRVRGGSDRGSKQLRIVMAWRRGEPPTESYAETRAVQLFRRLGFDAWRQLTVASGRQILHRVDLVLPFHSMVRPSLLRPEHGLLVEIDGREVHEPQFERDHRRQSTYDSLGYHWVSFTPTQIERSPLEVQAAIAGVLQRIRATPLTHPRNSRP